MVTIVEEGSEHCAAVAALNRVAFGEEYEAGLVERLRRDGVVVLSLVAVERGEVVGHILFSDLTVEVDARPIAAVSLASMAVRPDRQRQGIGSALIAEGLSILRKNRQSVVLVLGPVRYYSRFGFSSELARKLVSPFQGERFMALELEPGALAGHVGSVRYPAAFGVG